MNKLSRSAVRLFDLAASLATPCSCCNHSEFIHTESGPCLFNQCLCPHFSPASPVGSHQHAAT